MTSSIKAITHSTSLGNYAEAIKNYLIAISLAIQSSADYYRNLGDLYTKVGDIEEAIRVYDYAFQQKYVRLIFDFLIPQLIQIQNI